MCHGITALNIVTTFPQPKDLDWWWDMYSVFWIMVTSVVIINLFIALMSDRLEPTRELGHKFQIILEHLTFDIYFHLKMI